MAETHSGSKEPFSKKGKLKNKAGLFVGQLAATGALMASPEAMASHVEAELDFQDKVNAASKYQETIGATDYPLQADLDSLTIEPLQFEELDPLTQENARIAYDNPESERRYYEVSFTAEEADEPATARRVFEQAPRVEGDHLSPIQVVDIRGEAYNENGNPIPVSVDVIPSTGIKEADPATGTSEISLTLGLPKTDEHVFSYVLYGSAENIPYSKVYDSETGGSVGFSNYFTEEELQTGARLDTQMEPITILPEGLRVVSPEDRE